MAEKKKSKENTIDVSTPEGKAESLKNALSQIEKSFGKGAIMKLGESKGNVNVQAIPTGCLSLDLAIGIGGIPRGRIIEIYGPESSGKTTLALHMVAEAQKIGGVAAFVDAEHAIDPVYAKNLGVNIRFSARRRGAGFRNCGDYSALKCGGYNYRGFSGRSCTKSRD